MIGEKYKTEKLNDGQIVVFVLLLGVEVALDVQVVTTPGKTECDLKCCHTGPFAAFGSTQTFRNKF